MAELPTSVTSTSAVSAPPVPLETPLGLPSGPEVYRAILQTSADGFWLVSHDGRLLDVNDRALEISGYTREEMLQKGTAEFVTPEALDDLRAHIERIRHSGADRFESVQVRKDGRVMPIEASVQHLPIGQGFFVAFVRDISSRKRAEQIMLARLRLIEVAQSRSLPELLQATLDEVEQLTGSSIGFFHFVDPDQQALTLQTWSTNTLKHMCTAEGAGAHYPIAQAGVWTDCLKTREPVIHNDYASLPHRRGMPPGHATVTRELVVPVIRGELITAIVGVGNKPVEYDDGDVRIVSTLADLAWDLLARKQSDDRRLELERRLLHAQRLESLGVLAGGIAHDFNNLLMAIMGNLDVAVQEIAPTSDCSPFIDEAMRASRRAAELTQQMLAYSGRGKFVSRLVNVGALVGEHLAFLKAAVGNHALFDIDIEPDVPSIQGDPDQIQQALINLLTNAAEGVGEESGVVRLVVREEQLSEAALSGNRTMVTVGPGRFVSVGVMDTGSGMDAATEARVFEPFFTTKFTGRGLGMSAVQGIMRGHQGAVLLSTGPERGCLVRLLFPVPSAEEAGHLRRRSGSEMASGRLVLVADDEPAVRVLCTRMLERMGFEVEGVEDGQEAVAAFEAHPDDFFVALLDLTMPKLDGLAVAQRLRARCPHLPVIVASGYGRDQAAERFKEAGIAGFIQKPYTMGTLQAAIARATHPDPY